MFRWIDTLPDGPNESSEPLQSNIKNRNSTVSIFSCVSEVSNIRFICFDSFIMTFVIDILNGD